MDSPWKVQNAASSSATLILLIFTSLFKGLFSQMLQHELMVPASVSVQRGLCVHIPCNFTSDRIDTEDVYGYWFQKKDKYWQYFVTSYSYHMVPGILVATNDRRVPFHRSVRDRFHFTGKVTEGSCSFSILNVKSEDAGWYYFRIESREGVHSYGNTTHMPLEVLVSELTEKPQIQNLSAIVYGMEAVFTCSVPGSCLKMDTKVLWSTVLLAYSTFEWSQQHSNGSWTYGSNFVFTPSTDDQGKWLTCKVWYPNVEIQVANTIILDIAEPRHFFKTVNKTRPRQREFWGSFWILSLVILLLFKLLFGFLLIVLVFSVYAVGRFRRERTMQTG